MKLTHKQEDKANLLSVAMALAEGRGGRSYGNCMRLGKLESMAIALSKRYEAACSYQWADTDKFRAATERLELRIKAVVSGFDDKHRVTCELQGDPRGSSLKLSINGLEYRL